MTHTVAIFGMLSHFLETVRKHVCKEGKLHKILKEAKLQLIIKDSL